MIGYKLFRVRKDGSLGSLFINKKQKLELGKTYNAKNVPTKGFKIRPGWHICAHPFAPHLSLKDRRWFQVRFEGKIQHHLRPYSQGGLWYTASKLTILKEMDY